MFNFFWKRCFSNIEIRIKRYRDLEKMFGELFYKLGLPLFPYEPKISKVRDFLDLNFINRISNKSEQDKSEV